MRINFTGKIVDESEITAGFIGCGSHAFRNLFPVFQFAQSILEKRSPEKGTLDHVWQVTRIFEAFSEGPGTEILLK